MSVFNVCVTMQDVREKNDLVPKRLPVIIIGWEKKSECKVVNIQNEMHSKQ